MRRYTPRQAFAFCALAGRRRRAELRENLAVAVLGAHGDKDALDKQLRDWE